jgi:hypothetical protein
MTKVVRDFILSLQENTRVNIPNYDMATSSHILSNPSASVILPLTSYRLSLLQTEFINFIPVSATILLADGVVV